MAIELLMSVSFPSLACQMLIRYVLFEESVGRVRLLHASVSSACGCLLPASCRYASLSRGLLHDLEDLMMWSAEHLPGDDATDGAGGGRWNLMESVMRVLAIATTKRDMGDHHGSSLLEVHVGRLVGRGR